MPLRVDQEVPQPLELLAARGVKLQQVQHQAVDRQLEPPLLAARRDKLQRVQLRGDPEVLQLQQELLDEREGRLLLEPHQVADQLLERLPLVVVSVRLPLPARHRVDRVVLLERPPQVARGDKPLQARLQVDQVVPPLRELPAERSVKQQPALLQAVDQQPVPPLQVVKGDRQRLEPRRVAEVLLVQPLQGARSVKLLLEQLQVVDQPLELPLRVAERDRLLLAPLLEEVELPEPLLLGEERGKQLQVPQPAVLEVLQQLELQDVERGKQVQLVPHRVARLDFKNK